MSLGLVVRPSSRETSEDPQDMDWFPWMHVVSDPWCKLRIMGVEAASVSIVHKWVL